MKSSNLSLAILSAVLVQNSLAAGIRDHALFLVQYHSQHGSEPDASPYFLTGGFRVITENPDDVADVSVLYPDAITTAQLLDTGFSYHYFNFNAIDLSALETEFTSGTYEFSLDGGTLGPVNHSLVVPDTRLWPDQVPAFSPDTFFNGQSIDPASDFSLYFNAWDSHPIANDRATFINIYNYSGGDFYVYGGYLSSTETEFYIPAHTLPPGTELTVELVFSSRVQQTVAGPHVSLVGYDLSTVMNIFTTGSAVCLGDLNGDTFVDDADFSEFALAYDILDCADPSMPPGCPADLDFDGIVDDLDFIIFAAAYNELICP